ncbi:potassium-transporting ATPase subunit KdpC [bacterium]|nr:potassium-transporting ATPase subunit KdpC [bacterium]
MIQQIRTAITLLFVLTILTGAVYPAIVTGIAQVAFPHRANGSLIRNGDRLLGSELIGQHFFRPEYFRGRLSATQPFPCNAAASGGSNYGPLHPALAEAAETQIRRLHMEGLPTENVPVDLVTASASGLDSHISPAAAAFQVPRVAAARRMSEADVRRLIRQHTAGRQFGVLGEARVNVLQLNLALDQQQTAE